MTPQPRFHRSMLFVPATRPDRFARALGAGADLVCIDLEDAVPAADKEAARENVLRFLAARGTERRVDVAVRFNAVSTRDGLGDLLSFASSADQPDFIILPKVREASEVRLAGDILAQRAPSVLSMIEDPEGLSNARAIAARSPGGLIFGAADFAARSGMQMAWEPLAHARSDLVLAAKIAGVEVMDAPFLGVADLDGLRAETHLGRRLGFTGKAAIHPTQIAPIHAAFVPAAEEIAEAQRAISAYEACADGLLLLDGKLVDKPVIEGFRRTLALAARAGLVHGA